MPISDLTGTKWVLNNSGLDTLNDYQFSINFISNSLNWVSLSINSKDAIDYYSTDEDYDRVYPMSWTSQAYRLITITGGDDVQNSTLISWLQANATQVPIVDLSGTEWVFNSVINSFSDSIHQYSINFTSNSQTFSSIADNLQSIDIWAMGYNDTRVYDSGTWVNDAYKTISVTDGTDVSNPDFIVWLTNNATIQESSSPGITIGTLSLSSVYCNGDITKIILNGVTLYEALPQLDTPTNLSVADTTASFDEVENAEKYEFFVDDISIGEYPTVTGYQVTVTNNGVATYDLYDGQDSTGIFLGSLPSSHTGTYLITSGYIYVDSLGYGFSSDGISTTNPFSITEDISLSIIAGGGGNN